VHFTKHLFGDPTPPITGTSLLITNAAADATDGKEQFLMPQEGRFQGYSSQAQSGVLMKSRRCLNSNGTTFLREHASYIPNIFVSDSSTLHVRWHWAHRANSAPVSGFVIARNTRRYVFPPQQGHVLPC